jgi:hypothetical protein
MTQTDADVQLLSLTCDGYTIECSANGLPPLYSQIKSSAQLVEEFDMHGRAHCCIVVRKCGSARPGIVVAQSCAFGGAGFEPGALLVPETRIVFIGAGERLLAYELEPPSRIWEDLADGGFYGWEQHDGIVLMAAELEIAAWENRGDKLWSVAVEPPWNHTVNGETITVDVMGKMQSFSLHEGPKKE